MNGQLQINCNGYTKSKHDDFIDGQIMSNSVGWEMLGRCFFRPKLRFMCSKSCGGLEVLVTDLEYSSQGDTTFLDLLNNERTVDHASTT